jgi:hypothetical protein
VYGGLNAALMLQLWLELAKNSLQISLLTGIRSTGLSGN